MIRKRCTTDDKTAAVILRLVLGVVFFAHGAQKMLGWFGGYGFSATMGLFTGMLHIAAPVAYLAIAAEFFGGLGLILGLLTRIAAFGIGINRIVAMLNHTWRLGILHELERHTERRGYRVSPAGASDGCISDDPGGRCVLD